MTRKLLLLIILIASFAGSAAAQTTTFNGIVKDLTNTAIPTGQVTFTLKPSLDTTISGNARFTSSTVTCEIHNTAVVSTSGTGNITVVTSAPQTWQVGDAILFAATADATLNANTVATPYIVTSVNSTTSFNFTQSGTHTNGAVGTVGGLYASGGTGKCAVLQNSAITPANTSYSVSIWPIFSLTSTFNTYAIGSGPVDISTIVPTPGQQPAYSFIDLFTNQTITGQKTFTQPIIGSVTGSAGSSTNAVNLIGPGSITGNYTHSGTETFTGPINCKNFNAVRCVSPSNPQGWTGADVFAQVQSAWTDCANSCTVYVAAGTYNGVATTLNYPMAQNGTAELVLDRGAVINYTGSGRAIALLGTGQFNVAAHIKGGSIVGTSAGTAGIYATAFSGARFDSVSIQGFTNGDGFEMAGSNTVDLFSCVASGNKNGLRNVGAVVSSVNYSANAIHWHGGQFATNSQWGYFEDGSLSATVGSNGGNTVDAAVFEPNGVTGSSTSGEAFIQMCAVCNLLDNYFENSAGVSPVNTITIGDGTFTPVNTNIKNNIFSSVGTTVTTINDFNSFNTHVEGNTENAGITNFYLHGALSRQSYIGCNFSATPSTAVNGVDNGADTYSTCMANVQTWVNSGAPGPRGYQFNALSGFNQDLVIRTRLAGINNILGQNIAGASIYSIDNNGNAAIAHLNQFAARDFAGSCAMAAGTSCTFTITGSYTSTPLCFASIASTPPATANSGSCALSGTTVTITAGIANSLTWNALLIGNIN